jgi:type III pantothenate kinase
MLIATDIGNSSITIGYFTGTGLIVQRITSHPLQNEEEYRQLMNGFIKENNIEKSRCNGIISSVVSSHTNVFRKILEGLSGEGKAEVLVIDHRRSGLGFKIKAPEELGTDRIANAVAAFSLSGKPTAVIDFGTATTITLVDEEGDYAGGAIMPGIGLMNETLSRRTSKLPKVELRQPETALGKDTVGCILSGLFIGTAGAVERLVSDMEKETGLRCEIILTGGYSSLVDRSIQRPHAIRPHLTLEGLKIIYEKNRHQ